MAFLEEWPDNTGSQPSAPGHPTIQREQCCREVLSCHTVFAEVGREQCCHYGEALEGYTCPLH